MSVTNLLNKLYSDTLNGIWSYETDEWWSDFFSPRETLIDNVFSTMPLLRLLKKRGKIR